MLSAVTYCSCDEESNWKRRKCKNRLKQIQKEEEVDGGKQGWDGKNIKMTQLKQSENAGSFLLVLWVHSLSLLPSTAIFFFITPHYPLISFSVSRCRANKAFRGDSAVLQMGSKTNCVCLCFSSILCTLYCVFVRSVQSLSNRRFILNLGLKFLLKSKWEDVCLEFFTMGNIFSVFHIIV